MRTKLLTLIAALLCSTTMFADINKVKIGNLYYNVDTETQTAEVTYMDYDTSWRDYNRVYTIVTAVIPETIVSGGVTYTVTSIGDHAFENCQKLTSVTIPNTVTSIEPYAFARCKVLPEIDIPNSVKTIWNHAFYSCVGADTESQPGTIIDTGLTTVNIGSGVTHIERFAFDDSSILTAINVSINNINYCSENGVLFSKYKKVLITCPCGKEGDYEIPSTVTTVKAFAFNGCKKLTNIIIPDNVTDIEDDAFRNCDGLPIGDDGMCYASTYLVKAYTCNNTFFSIREGTRWIGPSAFSGQTDVTSVTIPKSVTTICSKAFMGCTGLSLLDIPDEVTKIGSNAFYNVKKIMYFGTATGGPWGAKSWIGGEKEVYTAFDRTTNPTTLTYYYDNRRESRYNYTEAYNPNALRFDGIGAVGKVVIDPSMKDAPLTSLEKLFYGGYNEQTGRHITLSDIIAIEGLENLNTANVTDMSYMFYGCSALEKVDLSTFNTEKLTTTTSMFDGCTALTTIYCNEDWSTKLTSSENMFAQCTNLKGGTWPKTEFDETKTDGAYARPCESTNYSDVTTPGYFTHTKNEMYTVFDGSTGTLTYYFDDRSQSRSGIVKSCEASYRFEDYNDQVLKAVIDPSMKNSTKTSFASLFYDGSYPLSEMTTIEGLENLNTAIVTDMHGMFTDCSALTTLDLTSFNTANVQHMYSMFNGCSSLKSVDLTSFNIDNLQSASAMFNGCKSLTTIYCDKDWSAIDGAWMFAYCANLTGGCGTTITIVGSTDSNHAAYARPDEGPDKPGLFTTKEAKVYTEFDTATGTLTYRYDDQYNVGPYVEFYDPVANPDAVRFASYNKKVIKAIIDPSMKNANLTSFKYMFWGGIEDLRVISLINLKSIEGLENLNTANVTNMASMFSGCNSLETLDLTTFDVSKVTDMSFMLSSCYALMTIFCNSDWSASPALTSDLGLFSGSKMIVGGRGTCYDSSTYDKTYARPDGGESSPGYFTMRGDANGDDQVNMNDAVSIVKAILGNPSSGFSPGAANVNGDVDEQGEPKVSISDAVGVVNMLQDESGISDAPAIAKPETSE